MLNLINMSINNVKIVKGTIFNIQVYFPKTII
jgi:hypothetical protein